VTPSPRVGVPPCEAHVDPMNSLREIGLDLWSDEMRFNPDGTIRPVRITFEGVKASRLPTAR